MHVERLQVDEGFLRGLDLHFEPGLNVLIGPRGVGKTSVVELIRYCLAAPAFTDKDAALARDHALSVLGTGQVTVTLREGNERVVVTRSAEDAEPQSSARFAAPTVLAQNEIEAIGLSGAGRLRLIDRLVPDRKSLAGTDSLRAELQSETTEIAALGRELEELSEQIKTLDAAAAELSEAQRQQANLLSEISATEAQQLRLQGLQAEAARLATVSSILARSGAAIDDWAASVQQLWKSVPSLEDVPAGPESGDELVNVRAALTDAARLIGRSRARIDDAGRFLAVVRTETEARSRIVADESRAIRVDIDAIQEGAGAIARHVAVLSERVAQRIALTKLLETRTREYQEKLGLRRATFKRLFEIRRKRFQGRFSVAEQVNRELGPAIHVVVLQGDSDANYVEAISSGLRGSGLHYNQLAPLLADKLGPRELIEAVEGADVSLIARVADIPADRAARVISGLRGNGSAAIAGARINDTVRLQLLDGKDYKDSESLSTGQRCTVVLPILLAHMGETLVIDQPEDHLDNAFITETLIRAIQHRSDSDQLIVTTHNPNIPVLGEADRVVLLGSDGKRSFVRHAEPLDHPLSVSAITTVMEGGLEAFERRARYYRTSSALRT